ncbi:MAG: hypothetical protein GX982_05790 [Tissierellia bacterium]|nr:hypothetical protein [Tissierellia bacterium]
MIKINYLIMTLLLSLLSLFTKLDIDTILETKDIINGYDIVVVNSTNINLKYIAVEDGNHRESFSSKGENISIKNGQSLGLNFKEDMGENFVLIVYDEDFKPYISKEIKNRDKDKNIRVVFKKLEDNNINIITNKEVLDNRTIDIKINIINYMGDK